MFLEFKLNTTCGLFVCLFVCLSVYLFVRSKGIPRLNSVFLTGYLGQDPKPKYFDNGKVVLNLSLAVKREYHPLEVLKVAGWE